MTAIRLRPYSAAAAPHIVALWGLAVGDPFPLREPVLRQCLEGNPSARLEDAVLAWEGDRLIGFGYAGLHRLADQETSGFRARGQIHAVVVDPARRRRGIGRRIAGALGKQIAANGVDVVEASGGMFYLWPGIPEDLPGALEFASAVGFELGDRSWDLRGDVTDLRIDPTAKDVLQAAGAAVAPATTDDRAAMLGFLFAEFGGEWWHETRWFLDQGGDPTELLLLRQTGGRIVGLARIHGPATRPIGPPHFWAARRPLRAGGLGPIGVAAELRGRGLGRALLVAALDALRRRGLTDVVIDFTSLLGYYGPHGFRPWISYRHALAPVGRLGGSGSSDR
ncbi:MAG: GNAT family N-acetyltransferase [Chloroflexi bacterium]|nr:GNAT family N-acetyltransferase [Chloroflexota bacterium]